MRALDFVALGFIAAFLVDAPPHQAVAAVPGFDPVAQVIAVGEVVTGAGTAVHAVVEAGAGAIARCDHSTSCLVFTLERVLEPMPPPVEVMLA
jgi:hypothetical protein